MILKELVTIFDNEFHKDCSLEWDNTGLLIGDPESGINKIIISLDADSLAIDKAIETKSGLIFSHHPLIFNPIKNILSNNQQGRDILKAAASGISVYCAHTNYDVMEKGLNDHLAGLLELENISGVWGPGRTGELNPPLKFEELLQFVKEKLNIINFRYIYDDNSSIIRKEIKKIAVVNGSANSMAGDICDMDVGCLICGEISYHNARLISGNNIAVIEIGHAESEVFAVGDLFNRISAINESLNLKIQIIKCINNEILWRYLIGK